MSETAKCAEMWGRVIEQALYDATLGVCTYLDKDTGEPLIRDGKPTKVRCSVPPTPILPSAVCVYQARSFIKGKTGFLQQICELNGADYSKVQGKLLERYADCQKYLPEEYQDFSHETRGRG